MSKQETFRRLLAGEYNDARHVTLATDKELLLEMRSLGWWPYSRPLIKDNDDPNSPIDSTGFRPSHKEGSQEWRKDIRICLENLSR